MHTSAADTHWDTLRRLATESSQRALLFEGGASKILDLFPEECISVCLTSPPYWGARDYGHPDQIGLENSLEEYISQIVTAFEHVKRVLRSDGTVWLNIGDKYLSGVGTENGRPPKKGWRRNKQLSLVPFRVAIALQEAGWWVRNTVVWNKTNPMPISAADRFANCWEPVFLLTKSERYWFNLDAVRLPHKTDDMVERARAERGASNGKARGTADAPSLAYVTETQSYN